MSSVHEYVAVNSREATNPNTQKQPKDLAFVSVDEAKNKPLLSIQRLLGGIKGRGLACSAPASMNRDDAVKETFNGRANSS